MEALQLSALMTARLCHDLASPITAISYGAELLAEDDAQMQDMAKTQIAAGTTAITVKLTFFRHAFGEMREGDADMNEIARLIDEYCAANKLSVRHDLSAAPQDARRAQLLLNMVIIAAARLPRGGEIRIKTADRLEVIASGEKVLTPEYLEQAIRGETPEQGWSARSIQPYFAALVAADLRLGLSTEREEHRIGIVAHPAGAE